MTGYFYDCLFVEIMHVERVVMINTGKTFALFVKRGIT